MAPEVRLTFDPSKRVIFDLSDPAQRARFPDHGWAINSQGSRLLWLPVNDVIRVRRVMRRFHVADEFQPGNDHDVIFLKNLRNLSVALRELGSIVRRIQEFGSEFSMMMWSRFGACTTT